MSKTVLTRNNVQVVGRGDDVLVLAHGFGNNQKAWHNQVRAFEDTHRIVLFDHVGAQGSDLEAYSPHRYASLESYSLDLIEVLEAVQARDVFYVGHSMSGMIGLLAGLVRPELFRSMLFISASPRYMNAPNYLGGFERPDIDALYETIEKHFDAWASGFAQAAVGPSATPEMVRAFSESLVALRPDIAIGVIRIIFESDFREQVARLTIPAWVVQPLNDFAVPNSVGEYLAKSLPQGQLHHVPNQGHLPHLTAPHEVNTLIAKALAAS
ncbi:MULTISPECIES: alpha/beta fold hydrolase [Myxococcus]|uniref:Alpha/beta hydrolase n=1 Tax=Myxococcus llanfairpwllgwyngyllgogerychwyrndrobwllllantysiliogogogochensis TaxID=2590453 RepID=A0A540X3K9_9BACT|nr:MULTISPECIES: alpha/beta hydrolase [Myxococcus]NTX08576.1 alpha/beta hydrolase [Myxococcus sp. CA040A]TQF15813.1 alpha/beta hydrolase [Myxococcus llanfairpwllgwyngyllgogerychwyrndrobwllllantysiliogogogochensis]